MSNSSNRIVGSDIQVGKSYVLPIEQSRVTIQQAKVNKIIAETDAKAQEIMQNADNKASVITETANIEAQRIIDDARKKAEKEYETIKQQAYSEGFAKGQEDGLAQFKNDAHEAIKSLEVLASSSFEAKKIIIDSATTDIVELVSAIAKKVCKASLNKEILYRITVDAIKLLSEKENITIIVNPKLVDTINSMVNDFKADIQNLEQLKIVEDNSVSPDGVIVETLSSRLDSRITSQIAEIARKMLTGTNDGVE